MESSRESGYPPLVTSDGFRVVELGEAEREQMRGSSWHDGMGCPGFDQLVRLEVLHWDFDERIQKGALDVVRDLASDLLAIFREVFEARFPIARMRPIHHYGGDDARSMADDNTSAFNCRCKVGGGDLSLHALGRAVDINPVENPYETASGLVLPEAGKSFARRDGRSVTGKGVLRSGDVVVRAFESRGFTWGGRWTDPVDWQHFEKPLG